MKRLFCIIFALFLVILSIGASAQRTPWYLVDRAGVLDDAETKQIATRIFEVIDKHDVAVAVLLVDSLDGRNEVYFADDYYDEHIGSYDGVLLLWSIDDDIRHVSTSGACIDVIDDNLSQISEAISGHVAIDDYAGAINAYIDAVDSLMSRDSSGGLLIPICISLAIGFIIAFIVTGVMKAQLDGAKFKNHAEDYVKAGSLKVNVSRDLFLYRTVNRTPKSQNNSSTHKSASGRTHGGGRV